MLVHRILVGYNGTVQSEHALEFVTGINWQYEVEIHLAFIVQEPSGMADPIVPTCEAIRIEISKGARYS